MEYRNKRTSTTSRTYFFFRLSSQLLYPDQQLLSLEEQLSPAHALVAIPGAFSLHDPPPPTTTSLVQHQPNTTDDMISNVENRVTETAPSVERFVIRSHPIDLQSLTTTQLEPLRYCDGFPRLL